MSPRRLLPQLLAVAILGGICAPAFPVDDNTPRPQRTFVEKPRIEDYADYNAFLVDVMEYRRQKQQRLEARQRAEAEAAARAEEAGVPLQEETLASISGQRAEDISGLYQISAPETLDEALERARKLPHPVYTEQERFGRTTSFSFPMPQIDGEDLYVGEVSGRLQDLELVNPDTFRNPGDEEMAEQVLAKNPSNEDEQADVKAIDFSAALAKPFYDMASRMIAGSDGKVVWLPIFIDSEAGTTVVRQLDIDVGIKLD